MQFRYLAFFLAAASAMASEHHHHRHHRHHDAEESCTNVSVEGDSTYCIRGPICSGSTNGSGACPKKGDTAVANCVSNIPSYVSAGVCKAKRDAVCTKLKTGAFGCAYPRAETEVMAADVEAACTNVSVEGDATYCIDG
ncbi:hypothetical protein SDRG_15822 [Saprolegnia diclina VS20]|uniref:Uncharacterized protein n=1 Tax=Saprolegnia diclina (strain VS20) TaxID=1156394 RepID=T0PLR9_SAPDV|nr:hypothetical protein SDRG_15822 [Saprolegnia diclina VS20]EQC26334.1 hypothetical protein SDRG_15822 [Saprolegnia diclina VS20]|eukprot:XP_008620227.1 hypothetical protein SDRG_15822 [Saprolegnia diclina VS20]